MIKVLLQIFTLTIFSNLNAQFEQKSLNFFAQDLLPKLTKTKVYFDGKIRNKSNYSDSIKIDEETILETIIWDYSFCKNRNRDLNNKSFEFNENFNANSLSKYANVRDSKETKVKIPNKLIFRNRLKTKKRISNKFFYKINKMFPQKYNLSISPSIKIEENTYLTRIYLSKFDFEQGQIFDIIVKNNVIVDWCSTSWIQ